MKYSCFLFDLDGTLVNSSEGITKSARYALEQMGFPEEAQGDLLRFIGPPLRGSFREFYGMSPQEAEDAVRLYRERYEPIGWKENCLYPGTKECLCAIQAAGGTVCLATSKPKVFARRILEQHDLTRYFTVISGCELDGTNETKSTIIGGILKRLGLTPTEYSQCVMIGDRHHDVDGARVYGIDTVGVSFGFAQPNELERAGVIRVVDSMPELQAFLLES